tara:strand:- start:902 stop:1072 length:171 start_codon:yes stop_codon:yes gene_type:complete
LEDPGTLKPYDLEALAKGFNDVVAEFVNVKLNLIDFKDKLGNKVALDGILSPIWPK